MAKPAQGPVAFPPWRVRTFKRLLNKPPRATTHSTETELVNYILNTEEYKTYRVTLTYLELLGRTPTQKEKRTYNTEETIRKSPEYLESAAANHVRQHWKNFRSLPDLARLSRVYLHTDNPQTAPPHTIPKIVHTTTTHGWRLRSWKQLGYRVITYTKADIREFKRKQMMPDAPFAALVCFIHGGIYSDEHFALAPMPQDITFVHAGLLACEKGDARMAAVIEGYQEFTELPPNVLYVPKNTKRC